MNPNIPSSWLTKPSFTASLKTQEFLHIAVGFLFTLIFIVIDMFFGGDANNFPHKEAALVTGALTLASTYLGWAIGNWWAAISEGDKKFKEAQSIDHRAEEEIQRISENWAQIIQSLKALGVLNDGDTGFLKASHFYIGNQQNSVRGSIERMALKIGQLGFSSDGFIQEKNARFTQIREATLKLVRALPQSSDTDPMVMLFSDVGPLLPEVAQAKANGDKNKNNTAA
jgi:hypothetical protein